MANSNLLDIVDNLRVLGSELRYGAQRLSAHGLSISDAEKKETSKEIDRHAKQSDSLVAHAGFKYLGIIYDGAVAIISPEKTFKDLTQLAKQADSPFAKRGIQAGAALFGIGGKLSVMPLDVSVGVSRLTIEPGKTIPNIPVAIAKLPSNFIDGGIKVWNGNVAEGFADMTRAGASIFAIYKSVGGIFKAAPVVAAKTAARTLTTGTKGAPSPTSTPSGSGGIPFPNWTPSIPKLDLSNWLMPRYMLEKTLQYFTPKAGNAAPVGAAKTAARTPTTGTKGIPSPASTPSGSEGIPFPNRTIVPQPYITHWFAPPIVPGLDLIHRLTSQYWNTLLRPIPLKEIKFAPVGATKSAAVPPTSGSGAIPSQNWMPSVPKIDSKLFSPQLKIPEFKPIVIDTSIPGYAFLAGALGLLASKEK